MDGYKSEGAKKVFINYRYIVSYAMKMGVICVKVGSILADLGRVFAGFGFAKSLRITQDCTNYKTFMWVSGGLNQYET